MFDDDFVEYYKTKLKLIDWWDISNRLRSHLSILEKSMPPLLTVRSGLI